MTPVLLRFSLGSPNPPVDLDIPTMGAAPGTLYRHALVQGSDHSSVYDDVNKPSVYGDVNKSTSGLETFRDKGEKPDHDIDDSFAIWSWS